MVHVIIIINPFDSARGRKDYYEPWEPNKPLSAYHSEQGEKLYAVNGVKSTPEATVEDGQEIVIAPKIEGKAFKWILAVGAIVASAGFAAGVIGGMSVGWNMAVGLGLSLIGNHLMSSLTAPKVDVSNTEQSNTYGWGEPQTLTGQGYALPTVYGRVKTAGQMLQRHVISSGEKQYLNILYCLAEGVVDDISDIKLNSNPIGNYSDVKTEIRNGSNQQSIIPEFDNSYADTALAYELNVGKWNTVTLDGNTAQGIEVTISFPQGLYYSNDSGEPDWTGVTLKIQYRKVGTSDWVDIPIRNENYQWEPDWVIGHNKWGISFTWREHYNAECRTFLGYETYTDRWGRTRTRYNEDGEPIPKYSYSMTFDEWKQKIYAAHLYDGVIRQKTNAAFYRMWGIHDLEPAQYEVRVQCTAKDRNDIRTANKVQWVAVTQVIYDDFCYPGKALLGLKALATDQLSGSDPSLTCTIERSTVYVWNPESSKYDECPANNPAWAAYDILHHCRKLLKADKASYEYIATGIEKEYMDYYQFKAWANQCDKANIKFNYLYDSAMKIWDALNYPCRVGHGAIVIVGTKVSCIYDYASLPVQLFTVANIKKDSFSNEYLDTASRANCVEISFMNKDKNYERDVLSVYSEDYDSSDTVSQPTQIELMGCTDVEQAYKYGKYLLRQNKYQIRTVQFDAFADAIACEIGDVITVQEDVTEWGIGGRIEAVNGNVITLDQEVDGDYTTLLVRDNATDNILTYPVSSISGADVTVNGANVTAGCVYSLGCKGYEAKQFKVSSISNNMSEETRTITAVEYYPEIYDVDTEKVPEIVRRDTKVEAPRNLILSTESYTESDGTVTALIHCAWINTRQLYPVCMEISQDGVNWTYERKFLSGESKYTFTALTLKTYYVRIYAVNDFGEKSDYVSNSIVTDGSDKLPPDVTSINVEKMASGLRRYWWQFTYPYPNDIAGFRIKYTQGKELNWANGIPVQEGLITNQPYETQTVRQGTHAIMIKAVDNAGNESENYAYCMLELGDLLEENVLLHHDFTENRWKRVDTDGVILTDGLIHAKSVSMMWNDKNQFMWSGKDEYMWDADFLSYDATVGFAAEASGQFWIRSEIEGPAIIYYKKGGTTAFFKKNEPEAFWKNEDAAFWDGTERESGDNFFKQYSDRVLVKKGEYIQIKVHALNSSIEETIVKSLEALIDVPDRNEHFEDIQISSAGTLLPIVTPNYRTTAVHLDAIQSSTAVNLKIVSRTPCRIQLIDANGKAVDGIADVSWQGYEEDK